MENLRKIIGLISISIVAIIIVLLFVINNYIKSNRENQNMYENLDEAFLDANKLKEINKRSDYFEIKSCVEKYINYLNEENVKKIMGVLPDFVKKDLSIDEENVKDKLKISSEKFFISKIYMSLQMLNEVEYEYETDINLFYVVIQFDNKNEKNDIIVLLDKINQTFYIIPSEYVNDYLDIAENNNIEVYKEDEIPNKLYNTFSYSEETEEEMGKELLDIFIKSTQFDTKFAYNLLEAKSIEENRITEQNLKEIYDGKHLTIKNCEIEYSINNNVIYNILCYNGEKYKITRKNSVLDFSIEI